jgi:hypothetical protein
MTHTKFLLRWICLLFTITTSLLWLHALGSGDMAAPPVAPDDFRAWLDHSDFTVAVFELVRLAALVLGYYALVITICVGGARLFSLQRATALIERLMMPFLRGALGGAALLGAIAMPTTADERADDATQTVTLHLVPNDPPSTTAPEPEPTPTPMPTPTDVPAELPPVDESSWTVQHGNCFWQIASDHLSDTLGREVSDHEVAAYWRALIEHNRSRLVTGDPNLLFAGQVIELPAVSPG